jgi:hypothetical protein
MLAKLWNLLRPRKPLPETEPMPASAAAAVKTEGPTVPPPSSPAAPPTPSQATFHERDDVAWERYENRETDGEYSWTYAGTTVRYRDTSWQFHEPETYRPKKVSDRFYNELSPDHVDRLLSKAHLEQAAQVAFMRRKQSDEARALADLLTRQCTEVYRKRYTVVVFQWRAQLLVEQGLAAEAIEMLTQRLAVCRDEYEREALSNALRRAERKPKPSPSRSRAATTKGS